MCTKRSSSAPGTRLVVCVPRPSLFYAILPLLCIILNTNQRTKIGGSLGRRLKWYQALPLYFVHRCTKHRPLLLPAGSEATPHVYTVNIHRYNQTRDTDHVKPSTLLPDVWTQNKTLHTCCELDVWSSFSVTTSMPRQEVRYFPYSWFTLKRRC